MDAVSPGNSASLQSPRRIIMISCASELEHGVESLPAVGSSFKIWWPTEPPVLTTQEPGGMCCFPESLISVEGTNVEPDVEDAVLPGFGDSYKDFTKPMPPGWTRHDAPEVSPYHGEPHLYPDGCEKYVFTHEAMPETDEGLPPEWYYPYPVIDIQESTPPFMPEQTQYLFCETTKACLPAYNGGNCNQLVFRNISKEEIGILDLVNDEFLGLFPSNVSENGYEVDLVAVCKTKTYLKTFNEDTGTFSHPLRKADSYLVLWVKWKDGIAYRLASGQVDAEEWEKLDQERISLIFG
ncbi:hypothetical protein FSARC_1959 [Fusarium sarcochroum]|uniref:Uncharacterized protein n=1 Tax=Fusarium sarcochroum TaxID=1208366 RepID=A0A8H4U7D1_9HYPO|nr:hypothetical protein FSARC_1959 [Fusarium sarcochroum]